MGLTYLGGYGHVVVMEYYDVWYPSWAAEWDGSSFTHAQGVRDEPVLHGDETWLYTYWLSGEGEATPAD